MKRPNASSKQLAIISKPWFAMMALLLGFFITVLEATIINVTVL